jgi:hypothetical protein
VTGKLKYSVETRPRATLITPLPTRHNLGSNPLRLGGKSVNNHLNNGTACCHHDNKKLPSIKMVRSPNRMEFIRFAETGVNNANVCSLIKGEKDKQIHISLIEFRTGATSSEPQNNFKSKFYVRWGTCTFPLKFIDRVRREFS